MFIPVKINDRQNSSRLPLIIEKFETLQEIGFKCKIMEVYSDFVSLQVHPSTPPNTICASLSESYSSILSVDISLKEVIKTIPDKLRWMTIPNIFVERHGHPNVNHFYNDGSSSEQGIGFDVYNSWFGVYNTAYFKLRQPYSVYVAELAAILYALLLISACPPDQYVIFSDSLSALEALKSVKAIKSPDYFVTEILKFPVDWWKSSV